MLSTVLLVSALTIASAPSSAMSADLPCHECSQTVWYVNANSPANGPGDSWATAFRRLPPALSAAAAGDCIWVAEGTYTPTATTNRSKTFKLDKAVKIYGGFAGNELCFSNRAGNFWGTVLSGDIGQVGNHTDNSYTIVTMAGSQVVGQKLDVVLDGFRIMLARNEAPGTGNGGGIFASIGSSLLLENCSVRRNEAKFGGGLYAQGCAVSIRNTGFGFNTADDGAGIYATGGGYLVYNAGFRANAARKRGGGAYLIGMGPTTTSLWGNVLFERNQAKRGGAMYLDDGDTFPPPINVIYPGRAHLVGCTVTRNLATVEGPAFAAIDDPIHVGLAGRLEVENSIVWNNGGPKPEIVGWLGTDVNYTIVPRTSVFAGGVNLPLDPMLVPPNFRLKGGSPAIDAASMALILPDELDLDDDGDTIEPTPLDWQRRPRVQGAGVDMGTSEY